MTFNVRTTACNWCIYTPSMFCKKLEWSGTELHDVQACQCLPPVKTVMPNISRIIVNVQWLSMTVKLHAIGSAKFWVVWNRTALVMCKLVNVCHLSKLVPVISSISRRIVNVQWPSIFAVTDTPPHFLMESIRSPDTPDKLLMDSRWTPHTVPGVHQESIHFTRSPPGVLSGFCRPFFPTGL